MLRLCQYLNLSLTAYTLVGGRQDNLHSLGATWMALESRLGAIVSAGQSGMSSPPCLCRYRIQMKERTTIMDIEEIEMYFPPLWLKSIVFPLIRIQYLRWSEGTNSDIG